MRRPDFTIGGADRPYLHRWFIIPRNRFFNIYLHNMVRDDDDRALHDHPWWNISVILGVGYRELVGDGTWKLRPRFSVIFRRATTAHRLACLRDNEGSVIPSWSLFITGPRVRHWGFHCPQGWVHWQLFTAGEKGELVGKGCDQ